MELKPIGPDSEKLQPASEDELIVKIQSGNSYLFEVIVSRYENRVFGYILRMVGKTQDAEELTQDCFLRAYSALREYKPQGCFRAWLLTIARNLCKTFWSRQYRQNKMISQNELPENISGGVQPNPEGNSMTRWFSHLPEDYRNVMTMKYVADLSCAEIARIEGISESAVKQRLHRGREMIREKLEKEIK